MSCNCKANKQIMKLHKNYGYNNNTAVSKIVIFNIKEFFKILLASLIILIISPIIFPFFILWVTRGKGNVNINKFIKKLFIKKHE